MATDANFKKLVIEGFEHVHTALDRISQLIDPDFEPAQEIQEIVKEVDDSVSQIAEIMGLLEAAD